MNVQAVADIQIRGSPGAGPAASTVAAPRPVSPEPWPTPGAAPETEPNPEDVQQAAEGVNAFLKSSGSHVQFAFHQASKRMMVAVIDDATQEVVRTIPSKELLDLAAKIGEMVGLLLDKKG